MHPILTLGQTTHPDRANGAAGKDAAGGLEAAAPGTDPANREVPEDTQSPDFADIFAEKRASATTAPPPDQAVETSPGQKDGETPQSETKPVDGASSKTATATLGDGGKEGPIVLSKPESRGAKSDAPGTASSRSSQQAEPLLAQASELRETAPDGRPAASFATDDRTDLAEISRTLPARVDASQTARRISFLPLAGEQATAPKKRTNRGLVAAPNADAPPLDRGEAERAKPGHGAAGPQPVPTIHRSGDNIPVFTHHTRYPGRGDKGLSPTAHHRTLTLPATQAAAEPQNNLAVQVRPSAQLIGQIAAAGKEIDPAIRMDADLVSVPGAESTQSGTVTKSQNVPLRMEFSQHLFRQVAEAIQQMPGRPVQITLSPEELGSVRLSLATSDSGLTLAVLAERPETMDLMRRHAPQLEAALSALGYGDIAFSFASGQSSGERQEFGDSDPQGGDTDGMAALSEPIIGISLSRAVDGGLDLRL